VSADWVPFAIVGAGVVNIKDVDGGSLLVLDLEGVRPDPDVVVTLVALGTMDVSEVETTWLGELLAVSVDEDASREGEGEPDPDSDLDLESATPASTRGDNAVGVR